MLPLASTITRAAHIGSIITIIVNFLSPLKCAHIFSVDSAYFWLLLMSECRPRLRCSQSGLTPGTSTVSSAGCLQLCLCVVPHVVLTLPPPPPLWCCLPVLSFISLNPHFLHLCLLSSCRRRTDICRGTLFRPLQFFCKVRYVNWLTLAAASRTCSHACTPAPPVTWPLTPHPAPVSPPSRTRNHLWLDFTC